jgi:excisionase family DNA binding protein
VPDWLNEELLTVREIAETLKLTEQTVRSWISAGDLPAVHIGRRVRVPRSDFQQFLRSAYKDDAEPMT